MAIIRLAAPFFMLAMFAGAATGADAPPKGKDTAPLGSPEFYPSPQHPIGWRGDWTGRYPAATPVTEWSYLPKSPSTGLRYQLKKPSAGDEGANATEVQHGLLLEWLVLGPFEAKDANTALDQEFIPKEGEWAPAEGDKAGESTWTKNVSVNSEGGGRPFGHQTENDVNHFDRVISAKPNGVLYAHLYLYSKMKGNLEIYLNQKKGAKIWVNGKIALNNPKPVDLPPPLNYVCYAAETHWNGELLMHGRSGQHVPIELEKGWNRVLIKATGSLCMHLVEAPNVEYEKKNIAWVTRLPNWSNAMPIVVGDKLFVMSEPDELVCINKADGKILWQRHTTFVDATGAEDKKRYPQFKELETINAELKKTDDMNARVAIRGKMLALLKEVDEQHSKTDPEFQEIYKFQAALKDAKSSDADKAQAVQGIRKKLAEMKCTRENNPLYQVIEPIEAQIATPETKPEDKTAMTKKLHEYMEKLGPKHLYPFHPCSHVGAIGFACPTPISDGKNVYVLLNGFGIAAAYDLEGNMKWAQLITDMGDTGAFHNNVPLLADNKLIIMRGSILRALDTATGKELWTSTDLRNRVGVDMWHGFGTGANFSSSPCICTIGGEKFVFFNSAVVRVSDGKVLAQIHLQLDGNVRSTPFAQDGAIILADQFSMIRIPLPAEAKPGLVLTKAGDQKYQAGDVAFYGSPVLHDGLLYDIRNDGRLWVYDANPPHEVYEQDMKLSWYNDYDHVGCVASVAMGGKYLYAQNNQGTMVVFEPGRAFKQVAENRMGCCVDRIFNYDPSEFFQTAPIFDGSRMYLRGEQNLYCIGAK